MSESSEITESTELDSYKKSKREIDIYLLSGIRLSGVIINHDELAIILSSSRGNQMIYKHAVATVSLVG